MTVQPREMISRGIGILRMAAPAALLRGNTDAVAQNCDTDITAFTLKVVLL